MLKTNMFKICPCTEYFDDLPNYANYLIKYAQTDLEVLRIRFNKKNYIRNMHLE